MYRLKKGSGLFLCELFYALLLHTDKMKQKLVDEYQYTADSRDKYCRLKPTQKYHLAQLIARDVEAGAKDKETKRKIEIEFKRMKGDKSELKERTYYNLKRD